MSSEGDESDDSDFCEKSGSASDGEGSSTHDESDEDPVEDDVPPPLLPAPLRANKSGAKPVVSLDMVNERQVRQIWLATISPENFRYRRDILANPSFHPEIRKAVLTNAYLRATFFADKYGREIDNACNDLKFLRVVGRYGWMRIYWGMDVQNHIKLYVVEASDTTGGERLLPNSVSCYEQVEFKTPLQNISRVDAPGVLDAAHLLETSRLHGYHAMCPPAGAVLHVKDVLVALGQAVAAMPGVWTDDAFRTPANQPAGAAVDCRVRSEADGVIDDSLISDPNAYTSDELDQQARYLRERYLDWDMRLAQAVFEFLFSLLPAQKILVKCAWKNTYWVVNGTKFKCSETADPGTRVKYEQDMDEESLVKMLFPLFMFSIREIVRCAPFSERLTPRFVEMVQDGAAEIRFLLYYMFSPTAYLPAEEARKKHILSLTNTQPSNIDCLLVNINDRGGMKTHVQSLESELIMEELDGLLENFWIEHESAIEVQPKAQFVRQARQFVTRHELFKRLQSRLLAHASKKFKDAKHYAKWFRWVNFPTLYALVFSTMHGLLFAKYLVVDTQEEIDRYHRRLRDSTSSFAQIALDMAYDGKDPEVEWAREHEDDFRRLRIEFLVWLDWEQEDEEAKRGTNFPAYCRAHMPPKLALYDQLIDREMQMHPSVIELMARASNVLDREHTEEEFAAYNASFQALLKPGFYIADWRGVVPVIEKAVEPPLATPEWLLALQDNREYAPLLKPPTPVVNVDKVYLSPMQKRTLDEWLYQEPLPYQEIQENELYPQLQRHLFTELMEDVLLESDDRTRAVKLAAYANLAEFQAFFDRYWERHEVSPGGRKRRQGQAAAATRKK